MPAEREFGLIKTYDAFKGYGFIRRQKGKDVFFFYADVDGSDANLGEGDHVSFEVTRAPKGPRAKKLRKEG